MVNVLILPDQMPAPLHTLFIAFDGLTDPLGRSQILPYLTGISKAGYQITILTCEKPERLKRDGDEVKRLTEANGMVWNSILYNEEGGPFSRIRYINRLMHLAEVEIKNKDIALVHCRSYLAALIGLKMKSKYGIPFVFDMRGFWADERLDGGIWSKKNIVHHLFYKYFKRKEKAFYRSADAIVSLTTAALKDMQSRFPDWGIAARTTIIPCCTNLDLFKTLPTKELRTSVGLSERDHVIVYAGSIGTWYYTREMIDCLKIWKEQLPSLKFLILTRDTEPLNALLADYPETVRAWIICKSCSYQEMPSYLSLAKASVFFIKPSYSKIASSPTKMAECWAMNLPIITNGGVGDNDLFFKDNRGGILINGFDDDSYKRALNEYMMMMSRPGSYRQIAVDYFDLRMAVKKYVAIYAQLTGISYEGK